MAAALNEEKLSTARYYQGQIESLDKVFNGDLAHKWSLETLKQDGAELLP